METNNTNEQPLSTSPARHIQSSFIEEDHITQLPAIMEDQPIPDNIALPSRLREHKYHRVIGADLVPDLHSLYPSKGLSSEINTYDANIVKETVAISEQKQIPATYDMPGAFIPPTQSLIPDWYRTGWTALSSEGVNPGGALNIKATHRLYDPIEEILPSFLYGSWYHNGIALFVTAITSYILARMNAGIGSVLVLCLFIASYYRTSIRRFRRDARDDIQRDLVKFKLEAEEESVEWMNSFVQKFWLIFEPVLSALVVENLDNYITEYLPPYLDSIRLSTFTLGTKPFRIESVRTFLNTDPDIVCMDWKVSFTPNDLHDLTPKELDYKVNPKIIMVARVGKGRASAGFPVLVENMAFSGHLRMTLKFMSKFPFIKAAEASFLEKPSFDYVLKPLGTDNFGFDVNIIPGLASFIREQVHAMLSPLMYAPNILAFDVEKLISGDFDFSSANGILAVTVYSTDHIKNVGTIIEDSPNSYVRFYLDHGQELDRTSVVENNWSPIWNETKYLKLNNLYGTLSMELRTSIPDFKDRRMGTAHFDLSQLNNRSKAEQEELNLLLLRNGKQVGNLRVDLRYLPVCKPTITEDGTPEAPVDSNSGILRLMVHECHDLVSPNDSISPYVRIIVNGAIKHETSIVKKNASPRYEEPYEIVVLDKTSFYLRAEVCDSADKDKILGMYTSYLKDIVRLQEKNDSWWDLTIEDNKFGRIRLSAEWKPIAISGLSGSSGGHGFDQPPIGVVKFIFWEAHNLRNVEMIGNGKSDPYIRVLSGKQIRGRTKVIDNNLSPEWGEAVYVPVHSLKENFVLEAMDWNNVKTKDKTLGMTEFIVSDIIRQRIGDQSVDPDIWYEWNGVKIDRLERLHSINRSTAKGDLHYSAEFFSVLELPKSRETIAEPKPEASQSTSSKKSVKISNGSTISTDSKVVEVAVVAPPLKSLHSSYIRYTPEDLIDLPSYNSGVLKIRIYEVQLSSVSYCYCQVIVDSLMPLYETAKLRGDTLRFNECADSFIKEVDLSRVAIEIKPAYSDEKDAAKLGYWIEPTSTILRRIMRRKGLGLSIDDEEGSWFNLMGTDGPARIRLGFEYDPMDNFILNPDESLDNQGRLTVSLVSGHNLMAADKGGTSDPYVIFYVNGEKVHKSEKVKESLNPTWKNETFTVPIESRVTASIRIEVFDWNKVKAHQPIGSGGITLRGDAVDRTKPRIVNIPLDGVAGVSGSIQVKFKWDPQLIVSRKTQNSVLGSTRSYAHIDSNLEASGPLNRVPTTSSDHTLGRKSGESVFDRQSILSDPYSRISGDGVESASIYSDSISMAASSLNQDVRKVSDTTGKVGNLDITLIEARGLQGVDKSGTSDPFVRLKVNKKSYKTKHIMKTLDPMWEETFSVKVDSKPVTLDLKVKDYNKFSLAVELGQYVINVWDLIETDDPVRHSFNGWIPLYPSGRGEIHIDIQFTPTI